jgi:hypothetical protein
MSNSVTLGILNGLAQKEKRQEDWPRGDDYRYRFEAEAKQRFIDVLRDRFNAGVTYKGRVLKWDTVIEQKANEVSRFLARRSSSLDFVEPAPKLERNDDREMRAKVLALIASQAKQLGIGKSTLHYLRKKAESNDSFGVRRHILARINRIQ